MCLFCLEVSREVRDLTRVMWSADGTGLFAICGHYINQEFHLCSNHAHITEQIRGYNGRRRDHFTVTNDYLLETSSRYVNAVVLYSPISHCLCDACGIGHVIVIQIQIGERAYQA